MNIAELVGRTPQDFGIDPIEFMRSLYPLCRSITGDGTRATLDRIGAHLPLERHEVPSGTEVLDWTVPKEWNIRDAWVKGPDGSKLIDFKESNLHVLNYSVPVHERLSLAALKEHLHTLPEQPELIPYRTSYYVEKWGFCLRHTDYEQLQDGEYEVFIDSTLEDGHLSYGELLLPGDSEQEVLVTTHICHPSMCNDNLSGIAMLTALGRALTQVERRWSWRLLFMPGTIGGITWLAKNPNGLARIRHGMVFTGLGDPGSLGWKKTRSGVAAIDRAVARALKGHEHRIVDFSPYGYEERQFGSPGFDLPVGRLSRSEYGSYAQYHTSGDDFDFVSAESLEDSFAAILRIVQILETDSYLVNTAPFGEPQLGRRGLYDLPLEGEELKRVRLALLWVLNLSDGNWSLEDIAERSDMPLRSIRAAADAALEAGLLRAAE